MGLINDLAKMLKEYRKRLGIVVVRLILYYLILKCIGTRLSGKISVLFLVLPPSSMRSTPEANKSKLFP